MAGINFRGKKIDMNLWLIKKNGRNSKKKMSVAVFLCFRSNVNFLGNNFAILRLLKFISRVQKVLIFSNLILKNISRVLIFMNLSKNAETVKRVEH